MHIHWSGFAKLKIVKTRFSITINYGDDDGDVILDRCRTYYGSVGGRFRSIAPHIDFLQRIGYLLFFKLKPHFLAVRAPKTIWCQGGSILYNALKIWCTPGWLKQVQFQIFFPETVLDLKQEVLLSRANISNVHYTEESKLLTKNYSSILFQIKHEDPRKTQSLSKKTDKIFQEDHTWSTSFLWKGNNPLFFLEEMQFAGVSKSTKFTSQRLVRNFNKVTCTKRFYLPRKFEGSIKIIALFCISSIKGSSLSFCPHQTREKLLCIIDCMACANLCFDRNIFPMSQDTKIVRLEVILNLSKCTLTPPV